MNARCWLKEVLSVLSGDDATRAMVTMWAIWYARRKALNENIFQSPLSTHSFVDRFMADLGLSVPPRGTREQVTSSNRWWLPPPPGIAKINIDAAVSKNLSLGSVAAVARDSDGGFLGASLLTIEGTTEPEMLEAVACRE
jgi:hypothetical protein